MDNNKKQCEELLSAWLRLSASLRNERMVKHMSFREISVCNILAGSSGPVTASEIVEKTGILKSQCNRLLGEMEAKKMIRREKDTGDKRKVNIYLTDTGKRMYLKEHKCILPVLYRVSEVLGPDRVEAFSSDLNIVADLIKEITANG